MSSRKQTPDLLGELLGEASPPAAQARSAKQLPTVETPKPLTAAGTKGKASRQPKPTAARRPIWEYLELTIHDYRGWRPRSIDGRKLRDWKDGPSLLDYLGHLGAEGWEMTGILEAGRGERNVYFKRLKK